MSQTIKQRRALRSVAAPPPPDPLLSADAARSYRVYPASAENARRWLSAVQWMQGRPGGSIWILDKAVMRRQQGVA